MTNQTIISGSEAFNIADMFIIINANDLCVDKQYEFLGIDCGHLFDIECDAEDFVDIAYLREVA